MRFNYQARNRKGDVQIGVINASSKETAFQILGSQGLYVTIIEEAKAVPIYAKKISFGEKASLKDLVMFSRQLAIMFRSRVPLVQSLRTIGSQTKRPYFKEKILKISEEVEAGTSFSDALAGLPNIFSSFYVNMVKSGEASGKLSEVLEYLADHLERDYDLTSKVKGAMVYPIVVLVVAVGVMFLLVYFVLPNLISILEDAGGELPLLTKAVIAFAHFARSWGWLALLGLIGAGVGASFASRTPEGKRVIGKILLKLPIIKELLRLIYTTRFAENLSTLITGGLPIVESLEITGDVVGNDVYKDIIKETKEAVKRGGRVSEILQKHPFEFPAVFVQMVSIGEESGTVDTSLMESAKFYQKEISRKIDSLLTLLEPAMIVTLGLGTALLMGAIMLPLYRLISTGGGGN